MTKYIFHGGCVSCQSQEIYGEERCAGCQCLEANWQLPDLRISEYEAREIETERVRRRIKGLSFDTKEMEVYLQEVKEKTGEMRRHQMRAMVLSRQHEDNSSIVDKVFKFFYDLLSGR
jgi:hypothetical protein